MNGALRSPNAVGTAGTRCTALPNAQTEEYVMSDGRLARYVHRLRIEEAKQMLETSDTSVEAIAAEVGYQDPSFFGRLFRRRVGLPPAHYRRRFSSLRRALEK